jgi:hypothetical protein
LITGKSGMGKSTYFSRVLSHHPAQWKFIFDHEGELQVRLGLPAITDPSELSAAVEGRWVVFDSSKAFPGRTFEAFDFFCDWVFEIAQQLKGPKLFCCDELQKLTDTRSVSLPFSTLLETGRRYEIDGLMVSQAPNLLHNRIRNQLTELVTFAHLDHNALQFLVDVGCNDEEVRGLAPGQFIALNLSSGGSTRGAVF